MCGSGWRAHAHGGRVGGTRRGTHTLARFAFGGSDLPAGNHKQCRDTERRGPSRDRQRHQLEALQERTSKGVERRRKCVPARPRPPDAIRAARAGDGAERGQHLGRACHWVSRPTPPGDRSRSSLQGFLGMRWGSRQPLPTNILLRKVQFGFIINKHKAINYFHRFWHISPIKKKKKRKKENTVSLLSPLQHADQQLLVPGSQSPDQHFGEFENHRAGSGSIVSRTARHCSDTASRPRGEAAPALIDTDAGGFIKRSRAHKHVTSLLTTSRAHKSNEGGEKTLGTKKL